MKNTAFISFIAILLFSSCSTFKDASFKNNRAVGKAGLVRVNQFVKNKTNETQGTFMWSHYDATKRGSMMYIDKDGKVRILAENPPDAAIQSITSITSSANVDGKVDAKLAFETSKSIAELGKRTAAVNMLRDALYRLNEIYYASKDERDETKKILEKAIDKEEKEIIAYYTNDDSSLHNEKDLSNSDIKFLFAKVIDNAKDIAIKEAEADIDKSKADIPKYEAEKAKIELLKTAIEKAKDSLTKEQINEYLNKL
jgi:hypothetical protein